MRVSAETKAQTRQRILTAAKTLFKRNGFDETNTRDISAQAGVAAGTLFNYFASKEALAVELISEALTRAHREFTGHRQGCSGLAESLFALVAAEWRHLRPHRKYLRGIVEAAFSPYRVAQDGNPSDAIRAQHLELVRPLIIKERDLRGPADGRSPTTEPSLFTMHLYWTLYLGALTFWTRDESPHQEESLAFLDHALSIFVQSATDSLALSETSHAP